MQKNCAICGKPITERHSHNIKYCSVKCARTAEHKKGIARIAERAYRISKVAQDVYFLYDLKCAICKWQATDKLIKTGRGYQFAYGNEIHHITPASKGGKEDIENLILLCPNHHKQADLGLIDIETLKGYVKTAKELQRRKQEASNRSVDRIASVIAFDRQNK